MSNLDGTAKLDLLFNCLKTTRQSGTKFYRSPFMTHMTEAGTCLIRETEFQKYYKGREVSILPKLNLKLAFLGLGWAQVRKSQLGLMPTTQVFVKFSPPPLSFLIGGGANQQNIVRNTLQVSRLTNLVKIRTPRGLFRGFLLSI